MNTPKVQRTVTKSVKGIGWIQQSMVGRQYCVVQSPQVSSYIFLNNYAHITTAFTNAVNNTTTEVNYLIQ